MIDRSSLSHMQSRHDPDQHQPRPVVDEAAVAAALDAGRLWGYGGRRLRPGAAAPGHPLIGRPDVMLTPHSAAQTDEGLRNMATMVAEDVVAVLRGPPPQNPVNDPFQVEHVRQNLGLPRLYRGGK